MMIDNFLSSKSYTSRTAEGYRAQLLRLFSWCTENHTQLRTLTADQFNKYLGEHPQWNGNSRYAALCAAHAYLRWRYGALHPLLKYKIKRPVFKPQRTLNEEEVWKLLAVLDTTTAPGIRNLSMISLMLDTGIRSTEVCSLKLADVDLKAHSIRLLCKGGQWGFGSYSDYTASCLDAWLAARTTIDTSADTLYVSCHKPGLGQPMQTRTLRHIFIKIAERAGLKKGFSPHDLRRSFATIALKAGAPTRVVQVAGRWRSIRMVERYSQALEAADILPFSPVAHILQK